jgi:branched-chain amino acid transport system substrate-binding protein
MVLRRALLLAGLTIVGACSSNGTSAPPDTASRFSTTVPSPTSDGVLRLGLLLPQSGDGSTLGQPLVAVAEAAVRAINDAGGVLGQPVELVVADEGPDLAAALSSVDNLINDEHIDALIGPLSSNVALEIVPTLVDAGIGVCSPAATAVSLANLPDDELFVRTSASDELAGQALAQIVAQTGVSATILAYPDDPFGRDLSGAIGRALALQGINVDVSVPFDSDGSDYASVVDSLPSDRVMTIVGDSESGGRFLRAVLTNNKASTIIVNDALAAVDLADAPELTDASSKVIGVAVDARAGAESVAAFLGAEAPALGAPMIDCINLLALASAFSGSDIAAEFMPQVIAASRGGSACITFSTCLEIIEAGLNIDYNGPTGVLSLDANGDPSVATFVTFGFDDDGRTSYRGDLGVFSTP